MLRNVSSRRNSAAASRNKDDHDKNDEPSGSSTDHAMTQYAVLYYKRKNKVHKAKGVCKMDGILTRTNKTAGLTATSTGVAVVAPRREPEILRAAQDVLEEGSALTLGAYEVEIVSRIGGSKASRAVSNPTSMTRKMTANNASPNIQGQLQKKTRLLGPATGVRRPLASRPIGNCLLTNRSVASKNIPLVRGRGVSQQVTPGSALEQATPAPAPAIASRGLAKLQSSTGTGLSRRTPILCSSTSSNVSRLVGKKRPLLPSLHPKKKASETSTSSTVGNMATLTMFPGAVGRIDLPHSIQDALKPHQRTGIVFLWNALTGNIRRPELSLSSLWADDLADNPLPGTHEHYLGGCILADEMGLGKTLMTIASICALYRQRRDKKFIVVTPSSLVNNWSKEFDKWLGKTSQPKRTVVDKGGQESLQQIKLFLASGHPQAPSVLILSYDMFRRHTNLFPTETDSDSNPSVRLLVVDEGHRLKNTAGSLTLTALQDLPCESRLLLTATPIQNVMSDFFTIANFTNPGILGDLASFRKTFERPIAAANNKHCSVAVRQRGEQQAKALEEITSTFMLRRLQKDVLKSMLPPRHEILLFCCPSHQQADLYHAITRDAGKDALTTLIKLRKLCLHPSLVSDDYDDTSSLDCSLSGKLKVLEELLTTIHQEAPGDKVVIVSNFTSALALIEDYILKPHNLSSLRLDGSTELSNRQTLVDTFNKTSSEHSFSFLLSSKAGGCGLNLIGANRLIMVDPDWNPASDIQAMARIYRQGQIKPCWIYRLFTAGSVEEVIFQRQMQKGNLAKQTVDQQSSSQGFTPEELKDCFTLKETACDTKNKLGKSWPAYDGIVSLMKQGCDDAPLLQIASSVQTLSFVHVVKPEDDCVPPPAEATVSMVGASQNEGASMTSEEEWQDDEAGNIPTATTRAKQSYTTLARDFSSSSDEEEYEFE